MKFKSFLFFCVVATVIVSCQSAPNRNDGSEVAEVPDSLPVEEVVPVQDNIVDAFFKEFQEQNDGWTKTEEGHKKLAAAFKKKITSDIGFAKACATYKNEFDYPIATSSSISSYSRDDGEEGEIKAFDYVIKVNLIKPLYNGQKEISVKYELINTIPSTIEDHSHPYVDNANYCDVFDSFLKNSYEATLNLGCYIITKKD